MKNLILITALFSLFTLHASHVLAEKVEVTLVDQLNGILNGYCIDVAGGNRNIDIKKGLQTHTCYSYRGELGEDQVFETSRFSDNQLYMPNYDVCATLSSLEIGAKVGLASCDNSPVQSITFTKAGKLTPVMAPELCLTAGEETRFGRGGTSQHQIKTLTLKACSNTQSAYQTWRTRTYDDDNAS